MIAGPSIPQRRVMSFIALIGLQGISASLAAYQPRLCVFVV
jgi:hypothetical protein